MVNEYSKKLKGIKSADEIINLLGKPDSQLDNPHFREEDKTIYGMKEQKRQFDYSQLSDTFILSVSEYVDGTFDYCFFGKRIK